MKRIFLLRHATPEPFSTTPDLSRTLTSTGLKEAAKVGDFLNTTSKFPELIICSNALRTRQTIEEVQKATLQQIEIIFTISLYKTNIDEIYQELHQIEDNITSVMLVGHNPSLSDFCRSLSKDNSANNEKLTPIVTGLQPASLVEFSVEVDSWQKLVPQSGIVETVFLP